MKTRLIMRIVSFALAAMLLFAFTGCTKEEPDQTSPTSKAGGQTTATTQKQEEELVQTKPFTFYVRANEQPTERMADNQKVKDYIQEQTGVMFDFIPLPQDGSTEKLNLMIASEEEFDAASRNITGPNWREFVDRGAFIPLNDLMDQYGPNFKEKWQDAFYAVSDADGNIWSIPSAQAFPTGYVPTYRKDWAEKLGFDEITTMAEFEKYMEAVKTQDPNDNGENDEIPYLQQWHFSGILRIFQVYFTGFLGDRYLDEDGRIMPTYAHPGFKDMLAKLADWYKKGYLHQEWHVVETEKINELIIGDRVATVGGWYSTTVLPSFEIRKVNPDAKYVPLYPWQDAPATGKPGWGSNPKYDGSVFISKTSKNAPFVMKYADWAAADFENSLVMSYGLKDVHWKWSNAEKTEYELIGNATENYMGFWSMGSILGLNGSPKMKVNPDDQYSYEVREMENIISSFPLFVHPFDHYVPYNTTGTPAEFLTGDGTTKIREVATKIITGQSSIDEWDAALEEYMKIEGDILSEVWTEQYKAIVGE